MQYNYISLGCFWNYSASLFSKKTWEWLQNYPKTIGFLIQGTDERYHPVVMLHSVIYNRPTSVITTKTVIILNFIHNKNI
jgi:hypothetical protein